jgi:hypothetical protein
MPGGRRNRDWRRRNPEYEKNYNERRRAAYPAKRRRPNYPASRRSPSKPEPPDAQLHEADDERTPGGHPCPRRNGGPWRPDASPPRDSLSRGARAEKRLVGGLDGLPAELSRRHLQPRQRGAATLSNGRANPLHGRRARGRLERARPRYLGRHRAVTASDKRHVMGSERLAGRSSCEGLALMTATAARQAASPRRPATYLGQQTVSCCVPSSSGTRKASPSIRTPYALLAVSAVTRNGLPLSSTTTEPLPSGAE